MEFLIHEKTIKGKVKDIIFHEPKIHADNEKNGRSGHMGHALAMLKDGRIIAFSANASAVRNCGHSGFGWMEYRYSSDYGETFSEPIVFPYSMEVFLDGVNSVSVEKAITLDNGDLIAFCLLNSQKNEICCEPWVEPTFVRSKDGGKTWEQPKRFSEYKGRIYDVKYHNGAVYALEHCNDATEFFCANKPEHVYRLFKSEDNCETFTEVSVLPFRDNALNLGYGNMVFREDGSLVVYAYNLKDEQNMEYLVSYDDGKTFTESGKSFVKNKIRNPQVGFLDGQYILHGRAGESEGGKGSFVIYTSKDGIEWDDGEVMAKNLRPACFYSCNLTVKLPNGKNRMLIKYSETYHKGIVEGKWGQVNSMMTFVESV